MTGCKQKEEAPGAQPAAAPAVSAMASVHTGVVQEVIQATEYTYLNVKEGDDTCWMAVTKREIPMGTTITYAPGLEMKNFFSKDLQRTFESIYFVDAVSLPGEGGMGAAMPMTGHQAAKSVDKLTEVIEPVDGGISIADLYGNVAAHGGQSVKIRGKVTKVNMAIMGKNWIHVQDGTEAAGNYDLTVTTQGTAKVGDVVVVEGGISLNKDFGAGYKYDVIMEDASCTVE
jgi:hypothetical protein